MNTRTRAAFAAQFARVASIDDLREVHSMESARWKAIQAASVRNFSVGARVGFSSARGTRLTGTVTGVNKTTVRVRVDGPFPTFYTVAPSLLMEEA